jgi:hypothetical protein
MAWQAWQGMAWLGAGWQAWRGMARHGMAWQAWRGVAILIEKRESQCEAIAQRLAQGDLLPANA